MSLLRHVRVRCDGPRPRRFARLAACTTTVLLFASCCWLVVGSGSPAGAATGVGSPDSSFGNYSGAAVTTPTGVSEIPSLNGAFNAVTDDAAIGDVVTAGYVLLGSPQTRQLAVGAFGSNGAPDTGFDGNGTAGLSDDALGESGVGSQANAVAAYPSGVADAGDVVAAGEAYIQSAGQQQPVLVRFNTNGTIDSTFTTNADSALANLITDSTGENSTLNGVAVEPSTAPEPGDVVVTGVIDRGNYAQGELLVAAFNTSGNLAAYYVTSYAGGSGGDSGTGIGIDASGDVYVGGSTPTATSGCYQAFAVELTLSGPSTLSLDTSFDASGTSPGTAFVNGCSSGDSLKTGAVTVQTTSTGFPTVAIAATEGSGNAYGTLAAAIVAFNGSGTTSGLAASFTGSPAGLYVPSGGTLEYGNSIAFIPTSSTDPTPVGLALGGTADLNGSYTDAVSYFSLGDGTIAPDSSFGNESGSDAEITCSGTTQCGDGLALQPDGSILVDGAVAGSSGNALAVARLLNRAVSVTGPGSISVTATSPSTAPFTISLNAASLSSGVTVTVNFATADGTASAGTEYTATSGTLTLPCTTSEPESVSCTTGADSATVSVPLNDAASASGNLTFTMGLSGPTSAGLGTASATATLSYPQTNSGSTVTSTTVASTTTSAPATTTTVPVTVVAPPAAGKGYYVLSSTGRVYAYGDAKQFGSVAASKLVGKAVAIATTSNGLGYWVVSSKGTVFAFGNAKNYGSVSAKKLSGTIRSFAPNTADTGYWVMSSTGTVYAFGKAKSHGSIARKSLVGTAVAFQANRAGTGYWIATTKGAVSAFGAAKSYGSEPASKLASSVAGFARTTTGTGYWIVTTKGVVYAFGNAKGHGSIATKALRGSVVSIVGTPNNGGYWIATTTGKVYAYGNAKSYGSPSLAKSTTATGIASV